MAIAKISVPSPQEEARQKVLQAIEDNLPKYFPLTEAPLFNKKTLYNLRCQGKGPVTVKIAGREYCEKASFMKWLSERDTMKRGRKRSTGAIS